MSVKTTSFTPAYLQHRINGSKNIVADSLSCLDKTDNLINNKANNDNNNNKVESTLESLIENSD